MDTDYASYVPPDLHIPWWMQILFAFLRKNGTISILLTLIGIDIMMGIGLSIVRRTLSSAICWRGMVKKVAILLILGAVAVVGPVMPQIPSFELACVGFIVAELISILEAAAALGVPMPVVLVDSLLKLKEQAALRTVAKTNIPIGQNVVVVNPAPASPSVLGTTTTTTEVHHTPPNTKDQ